MKKTGSISFLMVTAICSMSFGREITLQEAIESGLQNNYEVKATEKLLKSKEYSYQSAKGYMYPTLNFSEIFMRTNEPGYAMWNTMSQKKLDFMTSSKFVDMTALNPMFGNMFSKPSYPEVNSWRTKLELQDAKAPTVGKRSDLLKSTKFSAIFIFSFTAKRSDLWDKA